MPCTDLRFLIVEDHELQSRVLASLLKTMGARSIHTAEDGQAALRVIRDPDRPVDIVVTDLSMPGMDGMEFIRHLSESGSKVSLILASALDLTLVASIANMARAYEVKLLGAIAKPLTAAKLVPLIEMHRAIEGEPAMDVAAGALNNVAAAWAQNEFEPCYQPRVDLKTGHVTGMSAISRWAHPARGLLEPQVFMPSIYANGLNDDFVWLIVQKSAAQCGAWQSAGHALTVSVHIPFDSLADVDLAARLKQAVINEGAEPAHMVLGVRESALSSNSAKALENLARLRVEGFGLAIEDFGSGSMAVEQLSQVAFTELTIRSSFVGPMDRNAGARAELALAAEYAHTAKIRIIADGVRSKDEWIFLRSWGCDCGQGPFISDPLEKGAVLGWLAQWSDDSANKGLSRVPGKSNA